MKASASASVGALAGGGLKFSISVPGLPAMKVGLSRFAEGLSDFRPFWREYVAPRFFETAQRLFEHEGDTDGVGRWAALSPAYAAWKQRRYPGKPILQRTGRLMASLTFAGGAVGPGGVFVAEKTRAELGTRVPYGIYHQLGTDRMPARVILKLAGGETFGRDLQRFVADQRKAARLGQSQ